MLPGQRLSSRSTPATMLPSRPISSRPEKASVMRLKSFPVVLWLGSLVAFTVAGARCCAAGLPGVRRLGRAGEPRSAADPLNTAAEESAPAISDDGLSLYFNRNLDDRDEDLYVSHRSRPAEPPRTPTSAWGNPIPLLMVNTLTSNERNATLSRDGLVLFFSSDRPGGFGGLDLYVSRRQDRDDDQGWSTPVNLGPNVNSAGADVGPDYVEDEAGSTVLYFTSNRPAPAGFGAADIYKSTLGVDGSFGAAVLVPELSSPSGDARPAIRTDGLELVLHSNRPATAAHVSGRQPCSVGRPRLVGVHARDGHGGVVVPRKLGVRGQ